MPATLWKGHLSFGLVSIPVKLIRAARAEKIHMHNVSRRTGSRVKQVFVPETSESEPEAEDTPVEARGPVIVSAANKLPEPPISHQPAQATPIARQDLVRAFEYQKEKYVPFEQHELESIAPRNSTTMEIIEFVKFGEVDPVFLETSYYVLPDKGGEKPYSLLFEALRKTQHSALAEVVMYRRDQVILIRAAAYGLVAHTLFHDDEVRKNEEFHTDTAHVKSAEVDLAVKLVQALAAPFDPSKFKDKYRERLQQAIAAKIATGATAEAPPAASAPPVMDIVAALKASLDQMKKPVARESGTTEAFAKKRRSAKRSA